MIHMMKEISSQLAVMRCGASYNPQRKTGRLDHTAWDSQVTCLDCKKEPKS